MSWGSEYEAREPREEDHADSASIPTPDGGDTNG